MKWWLISSDDIQIVIMALQAAIDAQDSRCAESGCMCDLRERPCSWNYSHALHVLESGLNETDCIPADFTKSEEVGNDNN
jgi:hypothetical protein